MDFLPVMAGKKYLPAVVLLLLSSSAKYEGWTTARCEYKRCFDLLGMLTECPPKPETAVNVDPGPTLMRSTVSCTGLEVFDKCKFTTLLRTF